MMLLAGSKSEPGCGLTTMLAARQALAQVVVGLALEHEGHARRGEGGQALTGRALEVQVDGVLRQALCRRSGGRSRPRPSCPPCGGRCGWAASSVTGCCPSRWRPPPAGGSRCRRPCPGRASAARCCAPRPGAASGAVEDLGEIQALGLPEGDGVVDFEQVGAADEVVQVRMPSWAMCSRASRATMVRKFTT